MKSVQAKATRKLVLSVAAYGVQALVFAGVFVVLLHAYNRYPEEKGRLETRKQNGLGLWEASCKNVHFKSKYVDCQGLRMDADMNVSLKAVEAVLFHLLSDVFFFRHLLPTSSSTFGYLLLRAVDAIISYSTMFIGLGLLVCIWLAYSFYASPYLAYRQYHLATLYAQDPPLIGSSKTL